MAEQNRAKGQFVQAGSLVIVPVNSPGSGAAISVDGCVQCDTVYLQSDYPVLFGAIGTEYNDNEKDNVATEFRTPPKPTFLTDPEWVALIRF